jgi:hypothetical protein
MPRLKEDLSYDFSQPRGELVRISDVSRARSFELLEQALRRIQRASGAAATRKPTAVPKSLSQ